MGNAKKISVLISGRGSNLEALLEAIDAGRIHGRVVRVLSQRADAAGLRHAEKRGILTTVVDVKAYPTRDAFDAALGDAVAADAPDLVVLAGFMRVLGAAIVQRFAGRMINIHPALLPSYPGLHTHQRALADGVKWHGCTVHFVTPEVDVGPFIGQSAVPVLPSDDEATLAARVLEAEHRLLEDAVRWFCADRLSVEGQMVTLRDALPAPVSCQQPQG
ncbi:MAG: phosphoribosylglycinamide formyltransferase [Burkholderiales bacterium]|jgi:phosphoribosylglycinamide formyltransferase-1|nr:phosphoribosylglycinamide formyltransferase [Burkholderiales bacterium]